VTSCHEIIDWKHNYKYTTINTQLQIHNYKYTTTNTQLQIQSYIKVCVKCVYVCMYGCNSVIYIISILELYKNGE
jgi:hypothetical protein